MKRSVILAVLTALLVSVPAYAGTVNLGMIDENAKSSDYVLKVPAMALRGTAHILLSATEPFIHAYKGTVEGQPVWGTFKGLMDGIYYGMDRAGRGTWDILTALAPRYNGAPSTHEC